VDITKEQIMAYADGELDPEESARVKKIIDGDDEAKAQFEIYIRSRELLTKEFSHIKKQPAPDYLVNTVLEHRDTHRQSRATSYISHWPLQSVAASLIVGAFVGTAIFSVITKPTEDLEYREAIYSRSIDSETLRLGVVLARELANDTELDKYDLSFNEDVVSLQLQSNFVNSTGENCKLFELDTKGAALLSRKYIITCKDAENDWYIYQ
jgi:hypothetical protein